MNSLDFNLSSDCFILERDQDAILSTPAAQSTHKTPENHEDNKHVSLIQDVYELINTGEEHIVLYHESATKSILMTDQDSLPIRTFTTINPIIPDDVFMSAPRYFEKMNSWLHSPNELEMSPISSNTS